MTTRYQAKRLPVHAGPAGWDAILPPRAVTSPLEGRSTCDVAVIGAGFAGLAAVRRIHQLDPRARVVLLDAGRVGEGAAGRNSGFMIDLPHELTSSDYAGDSEGADRRLIRFNRAAIAFAAEAVAEYGLGRDLFDPAGKVNGASGPLGEARNHSYADHLASLGEPCEALDARAMFELTGSRYYRSGLFTPGTLMIQPAGFVRGLADGLARHVAIHEGSPVTGFTRQGDVWEIETPRARLSAGRIVMATNGHLESFGFARGRLMHVFLFAVMTEALGEAALKRLGGMPRWGITPSDPMGTTMRRIDAGQGGHRIVTRACAAFRPGMETTPAQMRRAAAVMRERFDVRFPQIAGTRFEHVWAGHLCLSRNGVSVTGEIAPGVFAACCQNGLGSTRGTLTGIAAAELACGTTSEITEWFAAQPAPIRLPPEPLCSLGAAAVLRAKEWQARRE